MALTYRAPRAVLSAASVYVLVVCASAARLAHAESGWPDERAAGPFYCHADFSLASHPQLLQQIADLQKDLVHNLEITPTDETIHLLLFHRESAYRNYLREYFPQVPDRRALFIKDRGPGMVFAYRNPAFEIDLRHESTHALLHAALPMVPLWLDEGLAEYFEPPPSERVFDNPHLSKVRWGVRFGKIVRMEQLENIGQLNSMGQSEYRQAWAWIHFMLHGPREAHEELVLYLRDIQSHSPPGQLSRRLRRRVPDLELRFSNHFKSWHR